MGLPRWMGVVFWGVTAIWTVVLVGKKVNSSGTTVYWRECPKTPRDKNQKAVIGGSWSDSGEQDNEKAKDKTYLTAHASSEVHSESSYFSDENSSIDDNVLDSNYDNL
nr:zf-CCHC domain-containing protein/DUF4219 domain-containing protein/UBN2 domain-containing protein [Tanacetum cinerariifolium]